MSKKNFSFANLQLSAMIVVQAKKTKCFLHCNKNIRFDFDDELKIGDVRYDNMTKITIKVQLF